MRGTCRPLVRTATIGISALLALTLSAVLPTVGQAEEVPASDELTAELVEPATAPVEPAAPVESTLPSDEETPDGSDTAQVVPEQPEPAIVAIEPTDATTQPAEEQATEPTAELTVVETTSPDAEVTDEPAPVESPAAEDVAPDATVPEEAAIAEDESEPVTATVAKAEKPAVKAEPELLMQASVPKNGWDASHTHYYKKGVAQTGIVGIKEGSAKRFYLFDKKGRLVKAKHSVLSGKIYVSNGSGLLAMLADASQKKGFRWLTNYGGNTGKQRYYLYRDALGAYYAVEGYSKDGTPHYTRPEGYVVRGAYAIKETRGSRIYLADVDTGKLATLPSDKNSGWITASNLGYKNRRYYLTRDTSGADKGVCYATYGYSSKGYPHYTTLKGYASNCVWTRDGKTYVFNKNAKLATLANGKTKGWLTSKEFAKGSKRYYLYLDTSNTPTKGAYYVKLGFSHDGYDHVTMKEGYVATSSTVADPKTGTKYLTNKKGLATKTDRKSIANRICEWAVKIANDKRYGYSQATRWTGEDESYVKKHGAGDFDCSSFVIAAVRSVGLKTGYASYTGDMRSELCGHGWTAFRYNGNPSSLQKGDILLNTTTHVELYLGGQKRVGAHCDENYGIGYGAKAGDQRQGSTASGYDYDGEISVRNSVGTWFEWVLRYKG